MTFEVLYENIVHQTPLMNKAREVSMTPENFRKAMKLAYDKGFDQGILIKTDLDNKTKNNHWGDPFGGIFR